VRSGAIAGRLGTPVHAWWAAIAAAGALVPALASAADLTLAIVDADGKPATQLAVVARRVQPAGTSATGAPEPGPWRVTQQLQSFSPEVLSVAVGATVEFPNLDRMRHHVFSFSPAKTFEIRLYSGEQIPRVTFDKPGPVAIGCNIHDWMQAYVYVADTPHFATADATGVATLHDLPPGEYRLAAWHPSLAEEVDAGAVAIGAQASRLSLSLESRLVPFDQQRPADDPLLARFRSSSD
jgi:plastocyanin